DLKNDLKATAEANAASPGRRRTVRPSRFGLALVALFASTSLFVGGFSLGSHVANTPGTPADQESRFSAFWDVYQLIQSDYAGYSGDNKPTQDQLVQAAIDGMIKSLNDPWSVYQAPDDFKNSLLSVGGQTEGIGVAPKLQRIDPTSNEACKAIGNGCEFAVAQVITDSPAEAAGMKAGDVIVSVDGASLDGKTQDQAIALIKGPKDTTVVLGLTRAGKAIDLTIVRKVFSLPEVVTKSLANGQVAYIAVNGMNQPASSQFDLALANAITAGQKNIIMDLRGNLGGYVDDAVKIASEFIPNGTIVWQEDAAGKLTEVTARPDGRATDSSYHLVVLVDGNTASAAEILAGALQARGRAKLIGAKTYGKGVVQEWLPLPNNMGGIHLTVAKWLLPDANKTWIGNGQNGAGLKPDVPIDSSNARAGTDPVLDAGLTALGFPPTSTPTSAPTSTPTSAPTAGPTSTP
ncbi:MAG TPA: S41 family peptidase, partial [Candidatus Limnocylindrales bacterium]